MYPLLVNSAVSFAAHLFSVSATFFWRHVSNMVESCLSEKNLSPMTFGDHDDDVRSVLGSFSGLSGLGLSLSGCSKKGFA